ncbi:MAG: hypothetical protein LBT35_06975 [Tannerella sp.]|nr:hypothetical protein [Tannerella sp.]
MKIASYLAITSQHPPSLVGTKQSIHIIAATMYIISNNDLPKMRVATIPSAQEASNRLRSLLVAGTE